jgi:hypothetical protein
MAWLRVDRRRPLDVGGDGSDRSRIFGAAFRIRFPGRRPAQISIRRPFFAAKIDRESVASGRKPQFKCARAQAAALYLFFYYVGSSLVGSSGGLFYARAGWPGVAGLLAALMGTAVIVALRLSKVPPPRHLIPR